MRYVIGALFFLAALTACRPFPTDNTGLNYAGDGFQSVWVCVTAAGKNSLMKVMTPNGAFNVSVHLKLQSGGGTVDISDTWDGWSGGVRLTMTSLGITDRQCYEWGQATGRRLSLVLAQLPITLVERTGYVVQDSNESTTLVAKAFLKDAKFSDKGDLWLDLLFDYDNPDGSTTAEIVDRILAARGAPVGLASLIRGLGVQNVLIEP